MFSNYKERILKEIEKIPENKIPKLYRVIHMLATELIPEAKKTENRGSLKGIWRDAEIDESLFIEARKSLLSKPL